MVNMIIGFALGFIVATVGVNGVISFLDQNVETAKDSISQIK
jgi:capsular polysaccharide biosynthesis protein